MAKVEVERAGGVAGTPMEVEALDFRDTGEFDAID